MWGFRVLGGVCGALECLEVCGALERGKSGWRA